MFLLKGELLPLEIFHDLAFSLAKLCVIANVSEDTESVDRLPWHSPA